ncbi:MAG: hypothetical protein KDA32_08620 [Phycisphaerales bacterium]|nr:hypothetical protein [Phycisphaerales bacterium]
MIRTEERDMGWVVRRLAFVAGLSLALAVATNAEIIEIVRAADTQLQRGLTKGGTVDLVRQGTSRDDADPAPVRVASRELHFDPNAPGLGVAAAQVLPPDLSEANPAEFACNITLNTNDPNSYYIGRTFVDEARQIVLHPDEVNAVAGDTVTLIGSLFIDGSLGMLRFDGRDLSGMEIKIRYEVIRQADSGDETLVDATIAFTGTSDGDMLFEGSGGFPTDTILRSDFDNPFTELIFQAAAFPRQALLFEYDAVVDEPFTLRVRAEMKAQNAPGETTLTAALGAPDTSLFDVLSVTRPELDAARLSAKMDDARAAAGRAADAISGSGATPFALPGCGLFGLESMLLLAFAAAGRAARIGRGW